MTLTNQFVAIFLLLLVIKVNGQEKKTIQFFQTDWGRTDSWDSFCKRTKEAGYDGIEIWFPKEADDRVKLQEALQKYDLKVGFLNGTNKSIPFKESLQVYGENLNELITWSPDYINCHTGSDFFTFEENKAFIDLADKISKENNIPIYHETHRGRFSFNLPDTKEYVSRIPELKLNLDISHWMVVHESLLEDKDQELTEIIGSTGHLHARIGYAEGPQVNDPEAPEWKRAVERHLDIWEKVIQEHWKAHENFTLTTEFGPPNYMHTLPYTMVPVADQWKANLYMMKVIKQRMNVN